MMYRGWWVGFDKDAPVTGRWRATRWGVGMCNNSKESLAKMIDTKLAEERKEREARYETTRH